MDSIFVNYENCLRGDGGCMVGGDVMELVSSCGR